MITNFDDLRDFALTFVDKLVEDGHIQSDIDTDNETEFDIQDSLIQHVIDHFKQDDCLIPDGGEAYEVVDINDDYGIAFIESDGIPLGMFTIFTDDHTDDEILEPRDYVSINHSVVYLT
jgi:hypothetical protein